MLAARAISGDFHNTFASVMYIAVASTSFIHIYTINTNTKSRESAELLEISRAMNISLEKISDDSRSADPAGFQPPRAL